MDRTEAEENLKLIRDVMERSARYTNFSGASGVIAGLLALAGCKGTLWFAYHGLGWDYTGWYAAMWIAVLAISIGQDQYLGYRKARRLGQAFFNQAWLQIVKAVLPGMFLAFVMSMVCLYQGSVDAIPMIWAMGHGVALCAAGMFTVREIRVFGWLQLFTGAAGLAFIREPVASFYLLAVSMGVYHIVFGLWMTRKYGW